MNDFFKKVMEGTGITPPTVCIQAFHKYFENTINVEWNERAENFEAIFYKDDVEYIAIFNATGSLLEYMLYLPEGNLPEAIKRILDAKGEIMNIVMRNKGNKIEYEAIVRDEELNRYLITFSDIGKILEEKKL